ncbi:hypothetical protein KBD81_05950 [Candidatus Woesebacteria bacterium]|nr:hypothetical protein [Candidatus Woesebacteria bacterium]
MITDADIEKLKQVFATKDDLSEMEQRMTKTILGKQDEELKPLKREQGIQRLAIKDHEIRIKHLEHPTL